MNLKETYNKIAEEWHKEHESNDWWVEGTDKFISFLQKRGKVLDVGCGSGTKSKYLRSKDLEVVGIDISDKLLEIARKEVPSAEFFEMDMRDLSGLENDFDGVFAQASLLHIPKKEVIQVLKQLISKLKPGGYLYLAVKEIRPGQPQEAILKEADYGYEYERFFSYFSADELRTYFKELQLGVVYEDAKVYGRTTWLQIIGRTAL